MNKKYWYIAELDHWDWQASHIWGFSCESDNLSVAEKYAKETLSKNKHFTWMKFCEVRKARSDEIEGLEKGKNYK